MSFIVEKNTGLPPAEAPERKYPFPRLNVGDSILVKGKDDFKAARMAAYQYGRRHDRKFHTGKTKTGGRITRVK